MDREPRPTPLRVPALENLALGQTGDLGTGTNPYEPPSEDVTERLERLKRNSKALPFQLVVSRRVKEEWAQSLGAELPRRR